MGLYGLAFPTGHDTADLSQNLCSLMQEVHPDFTQCGSLNDITGSEFVEYYSRQASFCDENSDIVAGVLDGSLAEAQQILETAAAETLYTLNSVHRSHRRQFLAVTLVFVVFAGIMYVTFKTSGRRLLISSSSSSSMLLQPMDVLSTCASGINSFVCGLPTDEFVDIFSKGVCAGTVGLACILTENDMLALAQN